MTVIDGSMISRYRLISPGRLAPASTINAWVSAGASRIVSGTPIRLLRFARVAYVRYLVPSTAASISLVLVFPLVPVTAMTGPSSIRRRVRARSPKARSGSSTWYRVRAATGGVPRRTIAAFAPDWATAAR
jgi:hypothetical protein